MSVIGDALRKAEDDGSAARGARRTKSAAPNEAASAKGIVHADAWVASTPRWKPSAATIILALLVVLTVIALTRPGWGEGLREYTSLLREAKAPLAVQKQEHPADADRHEPRLPARAAGPVTGPAVAIDQLLQPPSDQNRSEEDRQAVAETETETAALEESRRSSRAAQHHARPRQAQPPPPPSKLTAEPRVSTTNTSISARFQLEGVMLGGTTRFAVINGSIVEVGQRIDGATVTAIGRRSVTIRLDDQEYRIPLRAGKSN